MLKKIKIKDLIPFDKNPRVNDQAVDRVLESLKFNGYVSPIVVNEIGFPFDQHVIAAGHTRWKALQKFGSKEVEIFVYKFESEKHFVRYNIEDNKSGEFAEWDEAMLAQLGTEFEIDLGEMGFEFDAEESKEGLTDEDDVPEVPAEPVAKLGQMWKLGSHRLLCGDSTDREQVERLMGGEKADMVFTDPPYGMSLDADYSKMRAEGKKWDNVIGDHDDFKDEFISNIFNYFDYVKEVFLWGADYYAHLLPNRNDGNFICWDKTLESNGNGDKASEFELCWSKQKHHREVIHFNWFRFFGLSEQDGKKRVHPTQKPLQVIEPFLLNYSSENEKIVDLFGGSGSTLIACEKTGRKCRMMELDEKYISVIIERWQAFTGKDAVLIETGQTYNEMKNASN